MVLEEKLEQMYKRTLREVGSQLRHIQVGSQIDNK